MCTMVGYTLEGYIYHEHAWGQSQLRFSSMISMVAKDMCVTKNKVSSLHLCRIKPLKTYILTWLLGGGRGPFRL
jgi:hypothetical protein